MKTESVEKLVWALIYGGLGLAMLGLWATGGGVDFAFSLAVFGGVLVATGAVLVWVRSRMGKRPEPPKEASR